MVGTRRSNSANTPSQFRPPRKRNNYTPPGTISRGTEPGPCLDQLSRDLLDASFMRMRPHIWYSILPSEDGRDDIYSGTRQRWEYLLPLLIHASLIQKNEKSSNGFDVITTKFNEFVRMIPGDQKCHFSSHRTTRLRFISIRQMGKITQYYVRLGEPLFYNPTKQIRAISKKLRSSV